MPISKRRKKARQITKEQRKRRASQLVQRNTRLREMGELYEILDQMEQVYLDEHKPCKGKDDSICEAQGCISQSCLKDLMEEVEDVEGRSEDDGNDAVIRPHTAP